MSETPMSTYTVPVPQDKAGARLDKVLAEALADLSRTRLKGLIQDGHVTFGGCSCGDGVALTDPAYKVQEGQSFRVTVPEATPLELEAQDIPLDVVFEDDDLIVIDKPAGLVVHPAAGNPDRTLVNALLAHCGGSLSGIGGVGRPGIVHRLDKDTSGLMVVAKTDLAHKGLSEQFAAHTLERAYKAVVWGIPSPPAGEIEGNIGRSPTNRKKMAVLSRGGKPALTRYKVLKTFGTRAALIECRLATGRTHQIRVHMTSHGHPLIGDPVYGGGRNRTRGLPENIRTAVASLGRQALHAFVIGFNHPRTGDWVRFEGEIPKDFNMLICELDEM